MAKRSDWQSDIAQTPVSSFGVREESGTAFSDIATPQQKDQFRRKLQTPPLCVVSPL